MPPTCYTPYSAFLSRYFTDKVQKLAVNAGLNCPNRDGTIGRGGCTYCNNRTFNPDYCEGEKSVTRQLERGKAFFSRKYPHMKYLAYFQAYTNTYGELDELETLYEEALRVPEVVGLVVGTRPDCVSDALLDYFARLSKRIFVLLEYGVESVNDATLERIHRGHNFAAAVDTIRRTAERGLPVAVHTILGLPGEGRDEMLHQADVLSMLPIDVLKLHQLQIVRGSTMAIEYARDASAFRLPDAREYARLVADYLERLRPDIAVERFTSQSPRELLIAPDWGMKNHEFVHLVQTEMQRRGTRQGCRFGLTAETLSVPTQR